MRGRSAFLFACGAMLAGCAPAPGGGGGIVSTNPCADAMLVELVPRDRIAAISHYSQDPGATSIPLDLASRFRGTRGTAEEVVAMRPDLVIASSFTAPATRAAYARAGLRTLYLDSPLTIEASKAQVTELAAALGVPEKGRAMNARIDRAVAAAAASGPPVPALVWIGGNMVSGEGNLLDEMLRRAGFSNQAAHYGLQFTGTLPAERIVADPPRVMLVPDGQGRDSASRAAELRRRALAHARGRVSEAAFPRSLVNCGGPVIAGAMTRLAQIRRAVAQ
ncbi:ABC transporter substrate-binding protein [Sphingomonas sp. HITSZ_GF]|uniref:ABC transporter substrate-binding protein n=1 Tax=Sphingomonas sp. HITSZ_GF TaxID=3037247 RepID=UPI00240DD594|nr:ABC transporter substrate-binding protein [Sphingomonas sp. HITSZ_GF]MDG2534973.1 ABC transporter substrate-binding protein [Sphingomonas sp. HITSZ_GF]